MCIKSLRPGCALSAPCAHSSLVLRTIELIFLPKRKCSFHIFGDKQCLWVVDCGCACSALNHCSGEATLVQVDPNRNGKQKKKKRVAAANGKAQIYVKELWFISATGAKLLFWPTMETAVNRCFPPYTREKNIAKMNKNSTQKEKST